MRDDDPRRRSGRVERGRHPIRRPGRDDRGEPLRGGPDEPGLGLGREQSQVPRVQGQLPRVLGQAPARQQRRGRPLRRARGRRGRRAEEERKGRRRVPRRRLLVALRRVIRPRCALLERPRAVGARRRHRGGSAARHVARPRRAGEGGRAGSRAAPAGRRVAKIAPQREHDAAAAGIPRGDPGQDPRLGDDDQGLVRQDLHAPVPGRGPLDSDLVHAEHRSVDARAPAVFPLRLLPQVPRVVAQRQGRARAPRGPGGPPRTLRRELGEPRADGHVQRAVHDARPRDDRRRRPAVRGGGDQSARDALRRRSPPPRTRRARPRVAPRRRREHPRRRGRGRAPSHRTRRRRRRRRGGRGNRRRRDRDVRLAKTEEDAARGEEEGFARRRRDSRGPPRDAPRARRRHLEARRNPGEGRRRRGRAVGRVLGRVHGLDAHLRRVAGGRGGRRGEEGRAGGKTKTQPPEEGRGGERTRTRRGGTLGAARCAARERALVRGAQGARGPPPPP